MELTEVLEGLLANTSGSDLSALRTSRLKTLKKKRKRWLGNTVEALDALLLALDQREEVLAAEAETAPAPVEEPAEETPATPAGETQPYEEAEDDTTEDDAATAEAEEAAAAEQAVIDAQERAASDDLVADLFEGDDVDPLGATHFAPDPLEDTADPLAETQIGPQRGDPRGEDFYEQKTVVVDAISDELLGDARTPVATEEAIRAFETPPVDEDLDTCDDADDHDEMQALGAEIAEPGEDVPDVVVADEPDAADADAPEPEDDPAAEPTTPGWTRPAELLFDDALRLFRLGDSDGALISLERLLASTDLNDDLNEFIRVNEERLLDLYHAIIGPWEKVPHLRTENDEPMPGSFLAVPKIGIVLERVDGKASMDKIMKQNSMTRLETVAVLSQLIRAKTITTEATL